MSPQDIEELLQNIFSPVLRQEIMVAEEGFIEVATRHYKALADAAQAAQAAQTAQTAQAAQDLKIRNRLLVMSCWKGGIPIDLIVNMASLPKNEVIQLMAIFENVKSRYIATKDSDLVKLREFSGLSDSELMMLIELLKQG